MDEVDDRGLWVTDVAVLDLRKEVLDEVDFTVNLSTWCDQVICRDERLIHVPITDGAADPYLFELAVRTVVERLQAGDEVLVHCRHGISRSTSVAATAIAHLDGIPFETALASVADARPQTAPKSELETLAQSVLEDLSASSGTGPVE